MAEKTKKSRASKIIRGVILGVILFLAVALVAVMLLGKINNRPAFIFGKAYVWILTDSMADEIPAETYILVEEISASEVEVNDVIIFTSDDPTLSGSLNTHRVIEIIGDNEEFVTKGDNNAVKDNYTAKADKVWGRYVRNSAVMTFLMRFFLSPVGLVCFILLFLFICGFVFIPDLIKANKKSKEEQKKALEKQLIEEEIEKLKSADEEAKNKKENNENRENEE